ncbi:MAG TPA: thioredoxin domain-containing protein [Candidatus Megaira endosymbiont of Hartmannula sinica]|nr:thioredoxin domain-containing protein [Candidatus Megaera endosymbiont of Hartmannula sinica]
MLGRKFFWIGIALILILLTIKYYNKNNDTGKNINSSNLHHNNDQTILKENSNNITNNNITSQNSAKEDLGGEKENLITNNSDRLKEEKSTSDFVENNLSNNVEKPLNKPDNSIDDFLEGDVILGNKESNIRVIEYFSPTCYHCNIFHKQVFHKIKKEYIDTNKIAYVIREVIATKQDLDAAILARCSTHFFNSNVNKDNNYENYLKFTDILLSEQKDWAFNRKYKDILTSIGKIGKITESEYSACINNKELTDFLIKNTQNIAIRKDFVGTPSIVINNQIFTSPSFNTISKQINKLLVK